MEILYNCQVMACKASEIRRRAPQLIIAGDWQGVRALLEIPASAFAGESAKAYSRSADLAVAQQCESEVYALACFLEEQANAMRKAQNLADSATSPTFWSWKKKGSL